jgi:chemotaxis protein MotB
VGALITFAEDSAELDELAKAKLAGMAPALLGKPNKIEIRGHATGRPLPAGSPHRDAWDLSFARCLATYNFLQQEGVEPFRMRLSQAGPHEPSKHPDNEEWITENSRVEIYMLGEYVRDVTKPRKKKPVGIKKPVLPGAQGEGGK